MEPKDLKEAELSSQLLPRNFPPSSLGSKKANTEPSEDDKKYVASKNKRLGINNALKRITSGGYGWYIKSILWQPKKASSDFETKNVGLFLVMLHGGISGIMKSRQCSFGKCIQTLNCLTNLYLFITLTSKFSSHSFKAKALDGSVSYHFSTTKTRRKTLSLPSTSHQRLFKC